MMFHVTQKSFTFRNIILTKLNQMVYIDTYILEVLLANFCQNNSVGIGTRYGLDGPEIEARCKRDFPHPFRPDQRPTVHPTNGYWVPFPGSKAAGAWRSPPTTIIYCRG
jgi:hypothetical protein